jgi:hypothetical protein
MRPLTSALAVLSLLLLAPQAPAIDLAKIDRSIRKEPRYRSRPKYCLLAFGPQARDRVWLVLDGDTLYVDRNGNGDLTEADERIAAPALRPGDNPFCTRERAIKVGSVCVGGLTHTDLVVSQMQFRRTMPRWQKDLDAIWRQVPDGIVYHISINLDRRGYKLFGAETRRRVRHLAFVDSRGRLVFADRPEAAPVIHFGGPLALCPPLGRRLLRGPDPEEMRFSLGTRGLGPGTLTTVWYDLVPGGAFPVVAARFPAAGPGKPPVLRKYVLEKRC